ncbi:hypothetical protein QQF64_004176 [Cirrhinus molitorella]|uniref:Uncharacterized protein n=1 Tax=Cirrhinus molitorella TaxID=172907 RepID=A0ABR3MHL3_9TELE
MLKLLSHAGKALGWAGMGCMCRAVMQTWHPLLPPPLLPLLLLLLFTGSGRPPEPRGRDLWRGPALMSLALRDYADSCWSEQASCWPAPHVNLNSSLRLDSRFWGLMRKNARNSRET